MTPGVGVLQLQIGNRRDVLAYRRERAENRRKLLEGIAWRRPAALVATHRHEHETEPAYGVTGRFGERCRRRNHGLKERQGHGRSHSAQERAAWHEFLRDDHK